MTIDNLTGDGTLGITIAGGVAVDLAGNTDPGGSSATFEVDNTVPTVTIGAPSDDFARNGDTVTFSVTYADANLVTDTLDLTTGDITLNATGDANGSIGVSRNSSSSFTVSISNLTGDGTLGITIAGGLSIDAAGNTDTGGSSGTFEVDNTVPTVTIGAPSDDFARNGDTVTFTVTYADANLDTTNLTVGDITLDSTGDASGNVSVEWVSGAQYNVYISNLTGDGTLGITIAGGVAVDLAGNTDTGGSSGTFEVDNTPRSAPVITSPAAPTVVNADSFVIQGTNAEADEGDNGPWLARLYEDVNDNGAIDVEDSVIASQELTGPAFFSFDTPLAQDAANNFLVTATDAAGNESAPSDVPTIIEDSTPPAITIGGASAGLGAQDDGQDQTFTWTISDANLDASLINVVLEQDGVPIDSSTAANGSFDFNADGLGEFEITVTASDLAGNSSNDSDSVSVSDDDTSGPPITLDGDATTRNFTWSVGADPSGNGSISVSVTKDSVEIFASTDLSGSYDFSSDGTGLFEITVIANDADNDRPGDASTSQQTLAVSIVPADHFDTTLWADFSTNSGWSPQLVGDFNGDGRDDIANYYAGNGTWWVSLAQDGGGFTTSLWADFASSSGWSTHVVGYFNDDEFADIASFHPSNGTWWVSLSNGVDGFTTTQWADFGTNSGWSPQLVGDFDGDGRDDIANYYAGNGTWWVSLAQDGGGFTTTQWADFSTSSGWKTHVVGYFNDDDLADIASFHPSNGTWWVSLAQEGGGFTTSLWADFSTNSGWGTQRVGDFNADGVDDIANFYPGNGTWWVSLSNGTNGFNTSLWADLAGTGWTSQRVGDFNGDLVDDLANFNTNNGVWMVSVSNGANGFNTSQWADFATNSGWSAQVAGNFNGDAYDDIANFYPGNGTWWVSLGMPSAPLTLNGPAIAHKSEAAHLTRAQLDATLAQALQIFADLGLSPAKLSRLNQLTFTIADLRGATLGQNGRLATLDIDAAGHGWSFDDDVAADEVDLLSVIVHELGHELGLEHDDASFMAGMIGLGERRLPTAEDLDEFFGAN
ncbi:MAG: beta strand repeat-containing protein [Gemmataceae bacterium]